MVHSTFLARLPDNEARSSEYRSALWAPDTFYDIGEVSVGGAGSQGPRKSSPFEANRQVYTLPSAEMRDRVQSPQNGLSPRILPDLALAVGVPVAVSHLAPIALVTGSRGISRSIIPMISWAVTTWSERHWFKLPTSINSDEAEDVAHVFDAPREVDNRVFVDPLLDDDVDLDWGKARFLGGPDTLQHPSGPETSTIHLSEDIVVKGVQLTVTRFSPASRSCWAFLASRKPLVVRARSSSPSIEAS